ncbi:MAG: hypothetical protein JXX28_15445 [Deltaproteobacteria bacterium]|nr:hypothetical protein [Deltaproteobacteria bacterium]
MFSAIAFILALGLVTSGGMWVLGRFSDVHIWRRRSAREGERAHFPVNIGFVPLDLGPDTLHWPSEIPVPTRRVALPTLHWPSESWTDPYFGKSGGVAVAEGREQPRDQQHSQPRQAPAPQPRPQPVQQPPQRQQPQRPAGGVPSQQEVAAMVGEHGLAGTVQIIRDRTGWDFQRAAKYLAKSVQDN